MGGFLRRSKSVGFLVICLGILAIVGAGVLPVGPATQRFGPLRVDFRSDNCGPAVFVAFKQGNSECTTAAKKRLVAASSVGLLVVAFGMALFAGGDEPHRSRIVASPARRVRRRSLLRSRGSRRYMPG